MKLLILICFVVISLDFLNVFLIPPYPLKIEKYTILHKYTNLIPYASFKKMQGATIYFVEKRFDCKGCFILCCFHIS